MCAGDGDWFDVHALILGCCGVAVCESCMHAYLVGMSTDMVFGVISIVDVDFELVE